MRTIWQGAVSFGLVHIPVKLYPATEKKDIKFNYLHEKCQTPVQYRKYCPACETEVPAEEIVRGYEYEKGRYVILKEEDMANIPLATTKTVEIVDFVDLEEIDPIYFEKSYFLTPSSGGQKAYALLKKAMEDTGKIAVAKVTIRTKESLAAVRVYGRGLIMETMFYPEEIRTTEALPEMNFEANLHDNEIKMAINLITNLAEPFSPEKYTSEYRKALRELIESKITGEELVQPLPAVPGKVIDLMEALKASVEMVRKEKGAAQGSKEEANAPGTVFAGAGKPL